MKEKKDVKADDQLILTHEEYNYDTDKSDKIKLVLTEFEYLQLKVKQLEKNMCEIFKVLGENDICKYTERIDLHPDIEENIKSELFKKHKTK